MEEPRNPGIVAVKKNLKDKDNYFIISSYSVQEYKNTRREKIFTHALDIIKIATIKEQFSFKIYNKSKAIPRKNVPVSWQMQRFLI